MGEGKERGYRKWFVTGAAAVLAVVLAAAAIVLVTTGVREQRYTSVMKTANNYYRAGDYENAVLEYENAIAIDDRKESAYLNLASAYVELGDYESAKEAVDRGLLLITSEALEERSIELETLIAANYQDAEARLLSEEEIGQISEDAVVENTVFDMVAAYTYTEYFRDFGSPDSSEKSGEQVILRYDDMDFHAVYYDLDHEKVLDADGSMPVATAKPNMVRFDSLRRIFSESGETFALSREKLQELLGGEAEFYQDAESGKWYVTAEYKGCKVTIETDEQGNVISDTAWNSMEPLNRTGLAEDEETEGEVSGYVQDATTGNGMRATLKIRDRGRKTGEVIKEIASGPDGSYTFAGMQGVYTAEVGASGYITEYLDLEITRGQVRTGRNVVLSPEVADGEIRIVLTWGSSPADLDAYAIGTSSGGASFNIHFSNPDVSGVGNLDVDDTSGYGPETITIVDMGAEFTFSVMDFRLEGTMPGSGAQVKVYMPNSTSAVTYTVPSGEGVLWEVFRYENGELTPVNRIYRRDEISTNSAVKRGR